MSVNLNFKVAHVNQLVFCDGSLLDSVVDVFQHVLVEVFVSVHTLQVLLELLFAETKKNNRLIKPHAL